MPTYQYACTESACGHRFDAVQSFSDDPLSTCPVCEGRLRKVFSAVGVVFKGSGFYRTDSREAPKAPAGKGAADGGGGEQKAAQKATSSSSSDSSGSGPSGAGASGSSGSGSSGSGSSSRSTSQAAAS